MPLTLVTGPANAAKAGAVLARLRTLRPQDPLLVVPTSADVDHYRRELAAAGIVFGAEVLTFRRLVREIAAAAGVHGRPDRKSTRLNSSHSQISYAVFCLKKKNNTTRRSSL